MLLFCFFSSEQAVKLEGSIPEQAVKPQGYKISLLQLSHLLQLLIGQLFPKHSKIHIFEFNRFRS